MSAQVQLGSRMLVPPRIGAFLSALPAFWGRLSASPWLRAHMTALPARPPAASRPLHQHHQAAIRSASRDGGVTRSGAAPFTCVAVPVA